jgi:hypothetical protein
VVLAYGKYIEAELIGEFYFFYKVEESLVRVGYLFGDGVCAYIGKGANAYFHEDKDKGPPKSSRREDFAAHKASLGKSMALSN